MSDLKTGPANSAEPPPRPRTSGWAKFGAGLAVVAAEIIESLLHPAAAEPLEIADAALPLIAGLILFITVVRGSAETVERVFRLLRWVRSSPEPPAPDIRISLPPATAEDSCPRTTAAVIPALGADPVSSPDGELDARQTAALRRFAVPPPWCRKGAGSRRHTAKPAVVAGPEPSSAGPGATAEEPTS